MAKTQEEIKNSLVQSILTNLPSADVSDGSVIRDTSVDPQAIELSNLYEAIDEVSLLQKWFENAELISEEDLDYIGNQLGLAREQAKVSSGKITFIANEAPTTNLIIGNTDGSGGIQVSTYNLDDGSKIDFVTTATVVLRADAVPSSRGVYEVEAPIESVSAGLSTNVGVGNIAVLPTPVSGISAVYNYVATTGGKDKQSNREYADAILTKVQSTTTFSLGTIETLIKSNFDGVDKIKVINSQTSSDVKSGWAVAYIKNETVDIFTDTIPYTGVYSYALSKRPVKKINSVICTTKEEKRLLEFGLDYTLTKYEDFYLNSMSEYASVDFLSLGKKPDLGTTFEVKYSYSQFCQDVQNFLDTQFTSWAFFPNILVKVATPVLVDVQMTIQLETQYKTTDVQNRIISFVDNWFLNADLGAKLFQESLFSDLLDNFKDEILAINYPFTVFKRRKDTNSANSISLAYSEYADLDSNSIQITFN